LNVNVVAVAQLSSAAAKLKMDLKMDSPQRNGSRPRPEVKRRSVPAPATHDCQSALCAAKPPAATLEPKPIREAKVVRDYLIPTYFKLLVGPEFDWPGMRVYMNSIMAEAGDPTDPVERMLLEQFMLAHYRLAKLHVQADAAKTPESQKVLNTAATRLMGEVRRLALSIRQYRQPASPRQFQVVHQQNVATAGAKQDVTFVDRSQAGETDVSFSSSQSELAGNAPAEGRLEGLHDDGTKERKVPGAGRRRKNQRPQAALVDG
jgi:hypothetical protein